MKRLTMSKVLLLIMIMEVFSIMGCKKDNAQSENKQVVSTPVTCRTSDWSYEVVLTNSVQAGTFQVLYMDRFGNTIIDTTITSTSTYVVGHPFVEKPDFYVAIAPGPHYNNYLPSNLCLVNSVILNIRRDSTLVQTTGVPVNFCENNGSSSCVVGTTNYVTRSYSCN